MVVVWLIIATALGAVVLVAALKAALGPDDQQHRRSDGATGAAYGQNPKHANQDDDDSSDGADSGGGG
jgi:hypothetical protein